MRTRSKTSNVVTESGTSTETGNGPNPITWTWDGYTYVNGDIETIIDEQPEYKRYGTCKHTRYLVTPLPGLLSHTRTGTRVYSATAYALYNRAIRVPGVTNTLETDLSIADSISNWQDLSEYALQSMVPSFREDISLVNFLLELKDLKRIPDLWSRRRTFLKNVANAHLNYKFGIAPLVSDITKLVEALGSFDRKIKRLEAGQGKAQVTHYATSVHVPKPAAARVLYDEGGGEYQVKFKSIWLEKPKYHASMTYVYKLPDLGVASNRAKALLDNLGVRPDLQIVWNAIPFSFLIDWFSQVGDFLGSLSGDNLQIPVTIVDFCHSVKYTVRSVLIDRDFGYETEIAYADTEVYHRLREIPRVGLPTIRGSDISSSEFLLGASLLVANS